MKKILVTTGIVSLMMIGNLTGKTDNYFGITAYAAEQTQANQWEGNGDVWRLKSSNGTYVTNSWVEDGGAWYLLDEQGYMRTDLVYDSITNAYYMLNPDHDGTYGRMLDKAGAYKVNNVEVYMSFNQNHDGTYGRVLEGLEGLKATGIKTTTVNGLPSTSVGSSTSSNNSISQGNGSNSIKHISEVSENNPYTGTTGDPVMDWYRDHPEDISAGTGGNYAGNWNVN